MANPEHLIIARSGASRWNQWERGTPPRNPDFSGIDFCDAGHKGISFSEFQFGDNARFDGCKSGDGASFKRAKFGDNARFDGCKFEGQASFEKAHFGKGARFDHCTFAGIADFREAQCSSDVSFRSAAFAGETQFSKATFGGLTSFANVAFSHTPNFKDAQFRAATEFRGARFEDLALFVSTHFGRLINFDQAFFASDCFFSDARFVDKALFRGAVFVGSAHFSASGNGSALAFGELDFSNARFGGMASFVGRDFKGEADFSNAHFSTPPDFRGTDNREQLNWTGTKFSFSGKCKRLSYTIRTPGWTTQSYIAANLRRLRAIASEIHAVDAERDLFVLERQAERGILWKNWWNDVTWAGKTAAWWNAFSATALMILYRVSSNCGRSVPLPLFWLVVSNVGFYRLYALLIDRPLFFSIRKALFDFTFASAIPFSATARPVYQSAIDVLFRARDSNLVKIPWPVQAASASQGVLNIVLLFLLALAVRNHFKLKQSRGSQRHVRAHCKHDHVVGNWLGSTASMTNRRFT